MTKAEAIQLVNKIAAGEYSPQELDAFFQYADSVSNEEVSEVLDQYHQTLKEQGSFESRVSPDFMESLKALEPQETAVKREYVLARRIAAAAVIVILMATGSYYFFFRKTSGELVRSESKQPYRNDVPPGGNKATLTLANGSKIILDSAHIGSLAKQGNTNIMKLDSGKLAYTALHENPTEVSYNVLTTPKGGQYQLKLPDGTEVWLNAASSIKYPTAFIGKDRNVEITGEAYFEVAKNAKMPFNIKVRDAEIQVLGTHFNINAYADEKQMKTTLLEGSIKITKGNKSNLLKPGQQAQVSDSGKIGIFDDADLDEAVAWKNGLFEFGKTDLTSVMHQIARWYDVEIVYENKKEQHFTGVVSRNINVSGVLKILESNGASFEIDGKKIIVK